MLSGRHTTKHFPPHPPNPTRKRGERREGSTGFRHEHGPENMLPVNFFAAGLHLLDIHPMGFTARTFPCVAGP